MMINNMILFLNSLDEERTINLMTKIPHKSEYSFIFSYLSEKQKKGLSQLTNMRINKISWDTLFQHDNIYFLNQPQNKLSDLINTLTSFKNIHLYLIITSLETSKKVNIKKSDTLTIIVDDSIYNINDLNLPIDYHLSLNKIPDYFIKGNTISTIMKNLQKKYHFTFEESQNIKHSLNKFNNESTFLKKIVENINQVIILTDNFANITYVNNYFLKITSFDNFNVRGKNIKELFKNEHFINNYDKIMSALKLGNDYQLRLSDNGNYYFEINFKPVMDNSNYLSDILIIINDISEIEELTNKDSITNIWNRENFIMKLDEKISNDIDNSITLVLLDLSNFKEINDTLGHSIGDNILKEVASRINNLLTQENAFSRFYCDEFIFMMPNITDKEDITNKVHEIINIIKKPFIIQEHT